MFQSLNSISKIHSAFSTKLVLMSLLLITNNSVILYKVYILWPADKGQSGNVALCKKGLDRDSGYK